MKYYTYQQLRAMSKKDLWTTGTADGSIDQYAQALGIDYYNKPTLLEMLSVKHREWINQ